LCVGERTAGCGVGGDSADLCEGVASAVFLFDDELNGADAVERCDGAAGDDGERGRERGDGDEAEVGAACEEIVGAERGLSVVDVVARGERGVARRMLEVPHKGRGIEEVDSGDAEAI